MYFCESEVMERFLSSEEFSPTKKFQNYLLRNGFMIVFPDEELEKLKDESNQILDQMLHHRLLTRPKQRGLTATECLLKIHEHEIGRIVPYDREVYALYGDIRTKERSFYYGRVRTYISGLNKRFVDPKTIRSFSKHGRGIGVVYYPTPSQLLILRALRRDANGKILDANTLAEALHIDPNNLIVTIHDINQKIAQNGGDKRIVYDRQQGYLVQSAFS